MHCLRAALVPGGLQVTAGTLVVKNIVRRFAGGCQVADCEKLKIVKMFIRRAAGDCQVADCAFFRQAGCTSLPGSRAGVAEDC